MTSEARMTGGERLEVQRFLERFFSPPNVDFSRIMRAKGAAAESVREWIAVLQEGRGGVALLPRLRDGAVEWYGLTSSERQLRVLAEDLQAFVGPSYALYRGGRGDFDAADPIDALVIDWTRGHALKFRVPIGDKDEEAVTSTREALDRMRLVIARRPIDSGRVARPVGRMLRDFYMAVRVRERTAAERYLSELTTEVEGTARIDPLNGLFLRVQLLAGLERWDELLCLPELSDLLVMRRPVAVTRALLQAVHAVHIRPYEASGDAAGAVREFREAVYPRYAGLFGSRAGLTTRAAVVLFLLVAVAGPKPDYALRDELLAFADFGGRTDDFCVSLSATLGPTPSGNSTGARETSADARELYLRRDYDGALHLALAEPPSGLQARLVLDCAYEVGTLSAAEQALRVINSLPRAEQAAVLEERRSRIALEWCQGMATPPAESATAGDTKSPAIHAVPGWHAWLAALEAAPTWSGAVRVAREGAVQWGIEDFLSASPGVERFAERLMRLYENESVRLALPDLLEFFQQEAGWPRSDCAPVYRAMQEVLVHTPNIGRHDLQVFVGLMEALLTLGAGAPRYAEQLQHVDDLWASIMAPAHTDWALDVLELLLVQPCPLPDRRAGWAARIGVSLQAFGDRVSPAQRELYAGLCAELGQPEIAAPLLARRLTPEAEAQDTASLFSWLAKRCVGVYSLTEGATRRFMRFVEEQCPSAVVQASHDLVASDRLRNLATTSDVLVMVTGSATHAATQFIEAVRPSERPILRPSGKGTASMIRVLTDFLRTVS